MRLTLIILSIENSVKGDEWSTCIKTDYHAVISADEITSMTVVAEYDESIQESYILVGGNGIRKENEFAFMYTFVRSI